METTAPLLQAIVLGQPRFKNPGTQSIQASAGMVQAWLEALKHGPAAAAQGAEGDFAVAVSTEQGQVFMAQDRFATYSLCYRLVEGQLQFAERADALADDATELDPQALFDYLYFHCIPSPRTIYKGIFRLPPGHYAWFDQGKLEVKPFWHPEFRENKSLSFEAGKEEFLRLMQQSVQRQFDGSKAACFLSGGTDSSTVAGMLMRACPSGAASYSIGFDAEGYDEMEYARLAARHFGTEHHEYYVTPDDLVRSIPTMAAHLDQPFGNSSVLPAFYCAKMAKEDGVSRLLAGDGGDELYGGNSRYATQRLFGFYDQVPGILRTGLIEPIVGNAALSRIPLVRKAGSYVRQAKQPMPDRLQNYNLITRVGPEQVLSPALLQQVKLNGPLEHQRQVWHSTPQPCSELNRELAYDWRYTLGESDLPKVRAATSLAGVSVGFPMLDQGLLDFSLQLPSNFKLRGQKLRWFFKESLRGFLPDEIITKRKQGFGLPFGVWTVKNPGLQKLARRSLDSLVERGLVRADYVHTLLNEQLPAYPGYFGEMVWILMMLEQWLERHKPDYRIQAH